MLQVKANDFLVHLAGVFAFLAIGLYGKTPRWFTFAISGGALLAGYVTRGGLVAFLSGVAICFFARPRNRATWRLLGYVSAAVFVLWATQVRVQIGEYREFSVNQLAGNLASTARAVTSMPSASVRCIVHCVMPVPERRPSR